MKRNTAGLLLAATVLLAPPAMAQAPLGNGPTDITADQLEVVDPQHLTVWRGDVDVIRGQDRIRADTLYVYFASKPSSSPQASSATAPGSTWGGIDHMVAEGHVFFVSPTQTARGDRAIYNLAPDTVTVTGDVIVVQGQNVIHGHKLLIDLKTNRATMLSGASTAPQRVRGIFYSNQNNAPQGAAPAKQP